MAGRCSKICQSHKGKSNLNILNELDKINSIFIDIAPVIYFIEAHFQFGVVMKQVVEAFQNKKLTAFTLVLTLAEVLPKPIELGNEILANKFSKFLKYGKNFNLIEITENIAESAGKLRGKYTDLKTIDALQIATAVDVGADAFLTNDKRLKQIDKIKVLILSDYL